MLSEHPITRRKHTLTSLNVQGKISGPGHSAKRRHQQTMEVAEALHCTTPDNVLPAFEGIILSLTTIALSQSYEMP